MKPLLRLRFLFFTAFLALPAFAAEPVILKIVGPEKALTFTAAEFAALPHTPLTAGDPYTQVPRHFTGVEVRELLARAGLPFGDKLRGPVLQLAVIFRSQDGYGVVFALADFDDNFTPRTLLLADREDGKPLLEKAAPFQLIVPGDKKAARWARMVTSIEIVSLAPKS
jgi:hypothetical protein